MGTWGWQHCPAVPIGLRSMMGLCHENSQNPHLCSRQRELMGRVCCGAEGIDPVSLNAARCLSLLQLHRCQAEGHRQGH